MQKTTKAVKSRKAPDAEQTDGDAGENAWEREDLDLRTTSTRAIILHIGTALPRPSR